MNHCLLGNFKVARECYQKCLAKSKTNPVLLRAYAIFTLAANDSPRAKVFKTACDMFKAAKLSDPELEKFAVAQQSFFAWAVISDPKSANALLNYALLHQCVLGEYDLAEKFYLRAMAVAPTDQNIIDNFELLEKQRLPGGVYAGRGPSQIVLKRSEVSDEKLEWGEWQRMFDRKSPDPLFKHFW
jgi:tetratricopeptide (TPR) repeat protein